MAEIDRLVTVARESLVLPTDQGTRDLWLWEHSERVMRLAQMLTRLPEVASAAPNPAALAGAALFHDAGWAVQVRQGQIHPWHVLSRPTNDIQRELGAALLLERGARLLAGETLALAAQAIRECNLRDTDLTEAQLVAEAENLDEVGPLFLLRQFRHYQAEGRPLEQLNVTWKRHQEYHYWEARIHDGFRFETTRRIAAQRLVAVHAFLNALERDRQGLDLAETLESLDRVVPPTPA